LNLKDYTLKIAIVDASKIPVKVYAFIKQIVSIYLNKYDKEYYS
jgi:hypothetical protein